jgi:hypothetical protein
LPDKAFYSHFKKHSHFTDCAFLFAKSEDHPLHCTFKLYLQKIALPSMNNKSKFSVMKSIILLAFLFISHHPAHAQKEGQPLADSLEQVLKRADISETERVDVLATLAYEYRNLLPRKAIAFGEQAELHAKKIHYEKKLGEIYLCQAYAYGFFNDIIKSYELALLAVKYNTEFNVWKFRTMLTPDSDSC